MGESLINTIVVIVCVSIGLLMGNILKVRGVAIYAIVFFLLGRINGIVLGMIR